MGYGAQALGRNELSRDAVDAVGLIVDAHQGGAQTLDELLLSCCKLHQVFLRLCLAALLQSLVGGRCVIHIVRVTVGQGIHHLVIVTLGQCKFLKDDLTELLEFLISVACFFSYKSLGFSNIDIQFKLFDFNFCAFLVFVNLNLRTIGKALGANYRIGKNLRLYIVAPLF